MDETLITSYIVGWVSALNGIWQQKNRLHMRVVVPRYCLIGFSKLLKSFWLKKVPQNLLLFQRFVLPYKKIQGDVLP